MRHRRPPGSVPPLTDVVGVLLGRDPVVVRARDGREVTVAETDVLRLKVVPAAPVRTAAIRDLEHAAALAWPGTEQAWLGGWLVRASGGFTGRGSSCVPLGAPPAGGVAEVARWYATRGLPARFAQPERLAVALPLGAVRGEDVHVLTTEVGSLAGPEVDVRGDLDDDWLAAYHYRGTPLPPHAADVLRAVVDGTVGFARISGDGGVLAIGRGAVTTAPDGVRWLGLTALEVAPTARRRGLGVRLLSGLAAWGAAQGAQRVYLQVAADNDGALALYAGAGFTRHHGYRYDLLPGPGL